MNKELWQAFDKLRGVPFSGHEGLVDFFQKEGIRFASKDLATWGQFLATRFGRSGGTVPVPEWLTGVFSGLAKDAAPKAICDPWAGVGFLARLWPKIYRFTERARCGTWDLSPRSRERFRA
jgi:hypothetical protein